MVAQMSTPVTPVPEGRTMLDARDEYMTGTGSFPSVAAAEENAFSAGWVAAFAVRQATAPQAVQVDREAKLQQQIDRALADYGHADTCAMELSPDAGYECSCWRSEFTTAHEGTDK